MSTETKRIASLIVKQLKGTITNEEYSELQQWVAASPKNKELYDYLSDPEKLEKDKKILKEAEEDKDLVWNKINTELIIEQATTGVRPKRNIKRLAIVFATGTILVVSWLVYRDHVYDSKAQIPPLPSQEIIGPGTNRAYLTLDDGRKLDLNQVGNGAVASLKTAKVNKLDSSISFVALTNEDNDIKAIQSYNTLTTPSGGQFQLTLPDGSQAWLNAESSISFPASFSRNDRTVRITGEVYFEIKTDRRPFAVLVYQNEYREGNLPDVSIEVLGTHFNVKAYSDEKDIKTTLLEGKVKLANKAAGFKYLAPGQQADVEDNQITVLPDADLEEAVAWKNGEFVFRGADIEALLRPARRWYNIQVSFPLGKPKDKYRGKIGRNVTLVGFLEILRQSEVKYKLEGRTLTVFP